MSNSSTGLPENIATFMSYLFGWISGLIFLFVEKSNATVKFHAAQSVVFFGACTILGIILPIIPALGPLAMSIVGLVALVVWIVQLVTSLMGKPFKLPVVSTFASLLVLKV